MTDMIKAVARAIARAGGADFDSYDSDVQNVILSEANAAIEAARPYIIAEYNERLMSDGAINAAMKSYAQYDNAEKAIKAAIQKAGE